VRPLAIASLSVRAVRNLVSRDLALGPGLNVVSGENGQGKTNLLEAAYLLATSRSFRTAKLTEVVRAGEEAASVRGTVVEDGDAREQSVGFGTGARVVRMEGKRPPTLAAYAVRTPTVVFHPGAVTLSTGGGSERRRLLDRVALYRTPGSLGDVEAYGRALRARQRVLETRGDRAADLDDWETMVVRHGLAVSASREEAAGRLVPAAVQAFARIGAPGLALSATYARSAPRGEDDYRAALAANRVRDRARGSASAGPHRDDLVLALAGTPVRGRASQGQHRAVVLALELAEIDVVAELRDVRPILLLDDVSSELDRARTAALFAALRDAHMQVLLTTTRPELIEIDASWGVEGRRDFTVVEGDVRPVGSGLDAV
jgi:DNA replication and repair protein RecF